PNEWSPAGDRRTDAQPPVGILVETHDLSGERHAQREQQQNAAGDPGQLARVLVRAEQEHLRHVHSHDGHHEIGAPVMQRAQEPAQGLLIVQVLQTGIRLVGRRDVDEGQTDAGHDLNEKTEERPAAEDIKPTAGAGRYRVAGGRGEQLADMDSLIDPQGNVTKHARFPFLAEPQRGSDNVGSWPPRTHSCPCSILYSYSYNPRGGGPDACEPSS